MTASSVEFFPCRVQLMGLPRSTTSLTSANCVNKIDNNTRPSIKKVRGISRNLFGTPDPVEMKHLYQQEAERVRSYVSQRYNIDTKILNEDNERRQKISKRVNSKQMLSNCEHQCSAIPSLIEQEFRNHEQRLLNEEHRLNFASSEVTSYIDEEIFDDAKHSSNVTDRYCEVYSSVRPKPYTRQSLITESFIMCKNRNMLAKNINGCSGEMMPHRKVKITEFPLKCQQKANNIKNIIHSKDDQKSDKVNIIKSTTNMGDKINCTTLSLQVVVSTKNAS